MLRCLLFLLLVSPAFAGEVPQFQAGDRVACVGDSITHGGTYHADVYLFYATRRPHAPFSMYNCGVSGDTTPGTNRRFADDIAVRRPNVATILLGMNDAWGWAFEPGGAAERGLAAREKAYDTYAEEMDKLVASLEGIGCRPIFLTPSIYDQTAELPAKNHLGKNDLLGRFAGRLRSIAPEHGGALVDFYGLMNRVNRRMQGEDPAATLVGADRVHPGAAGHLVMAYALLKAQGPFEPVCEIDLDVSGAVLAQENCAVGAVEAADGGLSFTCVENALPFPVRVGQRPALGLVPFQEELNRQVLRVAGLAAGDYRLRIDGAGVGVYSADELAAGVSLSANEKTPQYRQSLAVRRANVARLAVVGKLRTLRHVRHTMISRLDPPVSEDDVGALRVALGTHVEKSKGKPWHPYLKKQVARFLEVLPEEVELRRREEELMREIWVVNRPAPHRWELMRVE